MSPVRRSRDSRPRNTAAALQDLLFTPPPPEGRRQCLSPDSWLYEQCVSLLVTFMMAEFNVGEVQVIRLIKDLVCYLSEFLT